MLPPSVPPSHSPILLSCRLLFNDTWYNVPNASFSGGKAWSILESMQTDSTQSRTSSRSDSTGMCCRNVRNQEISDGIRRKKSATPARMIRTTSSFALSNRGEERLFSHKLCVLRCPALQSTFCPFRVIKLLLFSWRKQSFFGATKKANDPRE